MCLQLRLQLLLQLRDQSLRALAAAEPQQELIEAELLKDEQRRLLKDFTAGILMYVSSPLPSRSQRCMIFSASYERLLKDQQQR